MTKFVHQWLWQPGKKTMHLLLPCGDGRFYSLGINEKGLIVDGVRKDSDGVRIELTQEELDELMQGEEKVN